MNSTVLTLEPQNKKIKKRKKNASQAHVVIMKKKTYLPGMISISKDDKVAFHNLDKIKHNVFSSTKGSNFDLGTYRSGKRPDVQLSQPGIVKVYCDIHPKMASFIMVSDSPFHQVANAKGKFDFKDIPAGIYTLKAWNIRGETRRQVEIRKNGLTRINLLIDTSKFKFKPHLNKKGKIYPSIAKKTIDEEEEYF